AHPRAPHSFPTRRSSDLELVCNAVVSFLHATHPAMEQQKRAAGQTGLPADETVDGLEEFIPPPSYKDVIAKEMATNGSPSPTVRSEEHTSELQSQSNLVC